LAHRWEIKQGQGGLIEVTCVLMHERGHQERVTLTGMPDSSGKKNAIQQTGSTVTYLQRYTLMAATGVASVDQDDDGGGPADEADQELTPVRRVELIGAMDRCVKIQDLTKLWNEQLRPSEKEALRETFEKNRRRLMPQRASERGQ
jgi:hypothetical protein